MQPSDKRSSARSSRSLCSATAALALTLCGCSTAPSIPPQPQAPLVRVSCPPRTPLLDDSFGAWVLKATELAAMYDKCRTASLKD